MTYTPRIALLSIMLRGGFGDAIGLCWLEPMDKMWVLLVVFLGIPIGVMRNLLSLPRWWSDRISEELNEEIWNSFLRTNFTFYLFLETLRILLKCIDQDIPSLSLPPSIYISIYLSLAPCLSPPPSLSFMHIHVPTHI